MELFLWRHAEAIPGIPDLERPLSRTGFRQAESTAKWLNLVLPDDALILVSPALRTRQTADALGRSYTIHPDLAIDHEPRDILRAAGWPGANQTVVVVGHQPTLGNVASILMSERELEWEFERSDVWWFVAHGVRYETADLKAVLSPSMIDLLLEFRSSRSGESQKGY